MKVMVSMRASIALPVVCLTVRLSVAYCHLVPSHDPSDSRFDAKRYWRGPSWLIVNYLITAGLRLSAVNGLADKIEAQSLQLIESSGFAEYYDPITGEPCGGASFTWTAAMVLEFCQMKTSA